MTAKRYKSVWDAIGGDPATAENLKIRAALMRKLVGYIEGAGLTQAAAAKQLGVTQPRISDLARGKVDLFSIDSLVNMLSAAGLHVDVRVKRAS
ncbi:MAG TPA: transcriptional regulator [Acidimicrobiaceae bacterium]|nr:transcriptional regulator [Acidimicrobiaceae bacterium]